MNLHWAKTITPQNRLHHTGKYVQIISMETSQVTVANNDQKKISSATKKVVHNSAPFNTDKWQQHTRRNEQPPYAHKQPNSI